MLQSLFDALIKQLPTAVIMLIGLTMLGFASTGHFLGKPLKANTIKYWHFIGWVLFIIGLIPTLIVIAITFWDNLQLYHIYIASLWISITSFFIPHGFI